MSDATLVITRVLNAPRERVWDAWVDPEQLASWFGPGSFTNRGVEVDARPGGHFRVVMVSPEGNEYPASGDFIAFEPPERLVYRTTSDDADSFLRVVRPLLAEAGADPDQDTTSTVTVTFEEHEAGTLLTIHTLFPNAAVREALVAMRMVEGWNESLDTLATHLVG